MKRFIALIVPPLKARPKTCRRLSLLLVVVVIFFDLLTANTSAHINSLLPSETTAGSPAFTLRVLGTDFDESDTGHLFFNGARVTTRLISAQELQATIPASLIASPGIAVVQLEGFNSANFRINPGPTIVTASPLPDALPGQPYSQRLEVAGGTAPFSWVGALPAGYGLSMDANGVINGTAIPTETAFAFEAKVTDALGARATKNFELRIRYPPCAGPCLFIEDVGVIEGDSGNVAAEFKVRLSNPANLPVRVDYSTQDFTAAAPTDYLGGSGTLGFNNGLTLNSIVVQIKGDRLYEAAEQFYVNLSNPVNATIARGQGICTIADNEPGTFTVCANDVPVRGNTLGKGQSTITVDRDFLIDNLKIGLFFERTKYNSGFQSTGLSLMLHPPGAIGGEDVRLTDCNFHRRVGNLGTTCSPSPNCVFDDDAAINFCDAAGASAFVGAFKPGFTGWDQHPLQALKRKNARGNWRLAFTDDSCANEFCTVPMLNCWCLTFELPREGCSLHPASATVTIFYPHTVRAYLTANGAPVKGEVVSFTVRGEQGEVRFQEDVKSDDQGVAGTYYYDFKPGKNFIEARAIINGVLSIATSEVTWVGDGFGICPFEFSTAETPEAEATLKAARNFRDDVLLQRPRGRTYTQLYYGFSSEIVQLMMFNPLLMLRSREIIERYKPVIQAMASGEQVTLTEGDLQEIDNFMKAFAAKGSLELQETVTGLCEDLRDSQVHQEFDITITDGPRRELPAQSDVRFIGQLGLMIAPLGLGLFCFCRRRSKSRDTVKSRQQKFLCAAIIFSTVSGQWIAVSEQVKASRLFSSTIANLKKAKVTRAKAADGKTALRFEANQGQFDSQVKFISRTNGYNLYLTPTEAVMRLRKQPPAVEKPSGNLAALIADQLSTTGVLASDTWLTRSRRTRRRPPLADVLRLKLIGAKPASRIYGADELPGHTNYFIGADSTKWRTEVPAYAKVQYENVYDGVDVVYYGHQGQLEYDFKVAPGANPAAIRLSFAGAEHLEIDQGGELVLRLAGREVRQRKPLAYQEVNGERRVIACRYILIQNPKSKIQNPAVGFAIGAYDASRPLVIDPVLVYSTYLGGKGDDEGNAITVDAAGNAYVIGFTDSPDFPTASAAQPSLGGGMQDVFITKLDPSSTQLLYSTYLGGNGQDTGSAMAIDAFGNAFLTGYTGSTNFPAVNALQAAKNGKFNAFVAKLSPQGALLYSTHLGGSAGDYGSSIVLDAAGNIFLAGVATSPNFPMVNALQPSFGGAADVFVSKLNASGSQLLYSTYLGGSGNDGATSLALDSAGNLYLTGVTTSANLPTANPLQAVHAGGLFDAFVAKLNPTGTQLVYSSYLGGSGEDRGFRIAADAAGNAYVTGDTDSLNFPTIKALQRTYGGGVDAFVAKLNPAGTALVYSTYLGGSSLEGGTAIAVDAAGSAYLTGFTGSPNFPTTAPLQANFGGGSFDGFVVKLNAAGSGFDYSTYLGGSGLDSGFGIAADGSGNAYVMGVTDSPNFPTVAPLQPGFGGGTVDVFVAKVKAAGPAISRPEIEGKHLLVFGSGFDVGAKIMINGEVHKKTSNDEQNPTGLLFSKKGGKLIARGQTVTLQVRNADGTLSNEFRFTRP
jgi:hypothetical protein